MVQKSSFLSVLGVFFVEPTSILFIKEISKRIDLAPPSVRNSIKELLRLNLIKKKNSKPFDGFIANRENEDFIFYKRVYNLYSLKELSNSLVSEYYPRLLAVFGSYSIGEDVESSDIDIFILSKTKNEINLEKFEKKLKRKINIMMVDNFEKIDAPLKKKIFNGIVLHGGF